MIPPTNPEGLPRPLSPTTERTVQAMMKQQAMLSPHQMFSAEQAQELYRLRTEVQIERFKAEALQREVDHLREALVTRGLQMAEQAGSADAVKKSRLA